MSGQSVALRCPDIPQSFPAKRQEPLAVDNYTMFALKKQLV